MKVSMISFPSNMPNFDWKSESLHLCWLLTLTWLISNVMLAILKWQLIIYFYHNTCPGSFKTIVLSNNCAPLFFSIIGSNICTLFLHHYWVNYVESFYEYFNLFPIQKIHLYQLIGSDFSYQNNCLFMKEGTAFFFPLFYPRHTVMIVKLCLTLWWKINNTITF